MIAPHRGQEQDEQVARGMPFAVTAWLATLRHNVIGSGAMANCQPRWSHGEVTSEHDRSGTRGMSRHDTVA